MRFDTLVLDRSCARRFHLHRPRRRIVECCAHLATGVEKTSARSGVPLDAPARAEKGYCQNAFRCVGGIDECRKLKAQTVQITELDEAAAPVLSANNGRRSLTR